MAFGALSAPSGGLRCQFSLSPFEFANNLFAVACDVGWNVPDIHCPKESQ